MQSIKPVRWVIVDDGSTDRTASIIKIFASQYSWIKYIKRNRKHGQSYYASNVYAIEKGVASLCNVSCEYIAILDADIYLPPRYYEILSDIFKFDKRIGIASGNCADKVGGKLVRHLYDRRSCAKAVMVFRKTCYEEIGGFVPLKYGGEDTCACFSARMLGWKTWAFHELVAIHNKPLGTGPSRNILNIRFRQGICDWALAAPFIFEILKSIRRCFKELPLIVGGLARMAGYLYAIYFKEKRQISSELTFYIRKEQQDRVLNKNKIPVEHKVEYNLRSKYIRKKIL